MGRWCANNAHVRGEVCGSCACPRCRKEDCICPGDYDDDPRDDFNAIQHVPCEQCRGTGVVLEWVYVRPGGDRTVEKPCPACRLRGRPV